MALCPITNQYTVTFTGTRADDGGQPEEVTVVASRYVDPIFVDPVAYDKRLDDEMTFTFQEDGIYFISFDGNVSGLLQTINLPVDNRSRRRIALQGQRDVNALICGECKCSDYTLMKGLLTDQAQLDTCLDIRRADSQLKLIKEIDEGCGDVKCKCGCG